MNPIKRKFNVAGARKAGYSDEEISRYLKSSGRNDAEVQEHLRHPTSQAGSVTRSGAKVTGESVSMPREDFIKEHTKLPQVLRAGTPPERNREAADQEQELKEVKATQNRPADKPHDYSSTQISLPPLLADKARRLSLRIADSDLAEEGREAKPHVTVLYGIHDDDPATAQKLLKDQPPIRIKLGATSVFPDTGSGEVVKIDVDSPELHILMNRLAGGLDHTNQFAGEYKPHVTLAYVAPGKGDKYSGKADLKGKEFTAERIIFSSKDGKRTAVALSGKPEAGVNGPKSHTAPAGVSSPGQRPAPPQK